MSSKQTATPAPKPSMATFNKAVRDCKTAAGQLNKANWTIGDSALTVETAYGKGTVQKFADAISVNYRTVLDLRFVAGAYAPSDRSETASWTVHQIFARLSNRVELVAGGSRMVEGKPWTTAGAREYVKSLADGDPQPGDTSDGDTDGSAPPAPQLSPLEQARANVARLQNELSSALLRLAKLEAEESDEPAAPAKTAPAKTAPAKTAPAKTAPVVGPVIHAFPNVQQHKSDSPRRGCPKCREDGVEPAATTPRNARNRVARAA